MTRHPSGKTVDLKKARHPCSHPQSLIAVFDQGKTSVIDRYTIGLKRERFEYIRSLVEPVERYSSPICNGPDLICLVYIHTGDEIAAVGHAEVIELSLLTVVTEHALAECGHPKVSVHILGDRAYLLRNTHPVIRRDIKV